MLARFALAFAAFALGFGLILSAPAPLAAQGNCPQCDLPPGCRGKGNQKGKGNRRRNCQRIAVVVDSDLDFGRIVILGSGEGRVILDLETGQRRLIGALNDIGGMPVTGRAIVTGAPYETVRIDLPFETTMRGALGGDARLRDFVTNLPALPRLDDSGRLEFTFSATLVIDGDEKAGGNLRGRVPISVSYE